MEHHNSEEICGQQEYRALVQVGKDWLHPWISNMDELPQDRRLLSQEPSMVFPNWLQDSHWKRSVYEWSGGNYCA